ncbi:MULTISPECIES: hypothetical protein [Lysobacter]|uniref:hypothetical protein n=1 Tax=Lysobacter TaxID=68 RepID=UPI001F478690|nr:MULTISPECIES: hypothetical protein [Lysobacter]UJB19216.1 hypothetical protein L1A79_23375 [Lysobacter capsici]UJQ27059.1 hypothetical protein L2D09_16510 [Lysobacter gummosus]
MSLPQRRCHLETNQMKIELAKTHIFRNTEAMMADCLQEFQEIATGVPQALTPDELSALKNLANDCLGMIQAIYMSHGVDFSLRAKPSDLVGEIFES